MSLTNYRPPQKDIAAGSVTLTVRGLNLDDVALLMAAHFDKLASAYKQFESMSQESHGDFSLMSSVIVGLLTDAPEVSAQIIALACDEPDATAQAKKLPFPVQVAALTEIGKLTFEAGGGLGNFLAALRGISGGLGLKLPEKMNPLPGSRPENTNAGQ